MIKYCIGEANLVFIGHAGETVGRSLIEQVLRKPQDIADLENFMNKKIRERAEIAGCIAKLCGVTDIVLRTVAGVYNTSAAGNCLADCIKCAHAESGGQVDDGVTGKSGGTFNGTSCQCFVDRRRQTVKTIFDIDCHIRDAQKINQLLRVTDVALHTIGHQNTDNTVFAECFCEESSGNAGVLAAGHAYNCRAAGTVLFKIAADPFDDIIFRFFGIA